MNCRAAALSLLFILLGVLLGPAAVLAGNTLQGPDAWPGPGTLVAGANHDAQTVMCQTQSMNCNQRCNKKYAPASNELRDCKDNCNTALIQCFNIANTIQN